MESRTRQAPAKVNLALDILGRREDGYHDMRMVMQSISLCDIVTVQETEAGFTLHTDGDFIPALMRARERAIPLLTLLRATKDVSRFHSLKCSWRLGRCRHSLMRI